MDRLREAIRRLNAVFLPAESIRFFHLDPLWLQCLLEGAFSVGFVSADHPQMPKPDALPVTGFLLRSAVVSGWPTLHVDGYSSSPPSKGVDPAEPPLPLLRMDHLSKNTLLCLFDGDLKTVDIHLRPERLHFGFSKETAAGEFLYKRLRYLDDVTKNGVVIHGAGTEMGNPPQPPDPVTGEPRKPETFEDEYCVKLEGGKQCDKDKGTINLTSLAKALKEKLTLSVNLNAAQFALQMIEGVEKIRFVAGQ